ncbi:MAG: hypothetical protein ACREUU_09885, partial [Gammaproteobacteria bacterium]
DLDLPGTRVTLNDEGMTIRRHGGLLGLLNMARIVAGARRNGAEFLFQWIQIRLSVSIFDTVGRIDGHSGGPARGGRSRLHHADFAGDFAEFNMPARLHR